MGQVPNFYLPKLPPFYSHFARHDVKHQAQLLLGCGAVSLSLSLLLELHSNAWEAPVKIQPVSAEPWAPTSGSKSCAY